MELDEESLHVLSCDISSRPRNAAGITELLPFVRAVETDGDRVIVDFASDGRAALDSFVSAERICCTGLSWELAQMESHLRLIVTGTAAQVSVIKKWFELA